MPRASGVYVPVQLAYEPKFGPDRMPGHYMIGFGYDSSRFQSFAAGLPASAGVPAAPRHGNTQFWLLVDQMLLRNASGDTNGLIAISGFVHNNPENSPYADQYIAGLVDYGFWHTRPKDGAGLLFSYMRMSGVLSGVQAEELALGLPVSNAATGPQGHEMILEANYNIHVYRGVDFRPEFQYIFRPNAQASIPNAAVFGFKLFVQF